MSHQECETSHYGTATRGEWPNHVLGTYGPMTVERTMSGPKLGWVLTVRCGSQRVEIRTSPKGRSGMSVEHVLYSSEGP